VGGGVGKVGWFMFSTDMKLLRSLQARMINYSNHVVVSYL
jgi:hypothetical protein